MPSAVIAHEIRIRYPQLDQAFYLDQWPLAKPILFILSPDGARQVTQGQSLLKEPGQHKFLKPLTGGYDLDTMEGDEWKFWHNVFSPGFRVSNIAALVPSLAEMASTFCDRLRQSARKDEIVFLSPMALDLTMDFSGKAIMDHDLHCQTGYNDFAAAMASQLSWLHYRGSSPLKDLNFIRPLVHRYNKWRMDSYINKVLSENMKFSEKKQISSVSILGTANLPQKKDYAQIKFMMLAGYDTTGSSIVFMTNLLSKHPDVLARVRAEHNDVFGPDITAVQRLISSQPKLLNQLSYTTAVIKEALRIYPPGATTRMGNHDFHLMIDAKPVGHKEPNTARSILTLPTKGCNVVVSHYAIHHNPRYWRTVGVHLSVDREVVLGKKWP
ncbi:cytochrome p450 [Colletotrichum incanum]|nr:cytochrome p450 [Colletotrichum incanum]